MTTDITARVYDIRALQRIVSALDDVLDEARSYQRGHPHQPYSFCSHFIHIGPGESMIAYVHSDRCQLDIINQNNEVVQSQRLSQDLLRAWRTNIADGAGTEQRESQ